MKYAICFLCFLGLVAPASAQCNGSYCRSYTTQTYAAPTYSTAYYRDHYYYKEYVPTVIEVNVNKDRYYSLSDLYRDRLYLEAFDYFRRERERDRDQPINPPAQQGRAKLTDDGPPPQPNVPKLTAKGSWGKTTSAALKVLKESCYSCHGKGHEKLDLEDPDAVPPVLRAAAFGLASTGDMPPAPKELRVAGKEEELKAWKKEHALKDEALEPLYTGWVMVGRNAALASRKQ